MTEKQQPKPAELSEDRATKSLFWIYRFLALGLILILLWRTTVFVTVATRDYERPCVTLGDVELLVGTQELPIANDAGVGVYRLSDAGALEAGIAENGAQVAPAKYLGWSLYNLDADAQIWSLVDAVRGDRFVGRQLGDLASIASPFFMLECSVRPGVFSGKSSVTVEKVTRALEMNPDMVQGVAYLLWTPEKKASAKPQQTPPSPPPAIEPQPQLPTPDVQPPVQNATAPSPSAPVEPTEANAVASPVEDSEDSAAVVDEEPVEVDLRTSIKGADIEQTETVIAGAANEGSAGAQLTPSAAIAVPPRKGSLVADIPAWADFEGTLPDMDLIISWDLQPQEMVGLLEKYGMAFYAPTAEGYRHLDGAWSCYSFAERKVLTEQSHHWQSEADTPGKMFGNLVFGFESLRQDALRGAMLDQLPADFGGDLQQGLLLLGSAILVANDAVVEFSGGTAPVPTNGAYEVHLTFTSAGDVIATTVKKKDSR